MPRFSFRTADRTVVLILANGIRSVAEFLTGVILARLLSQEDFGSYRQLLLLFATLAGITGMGLPQSLLYFVPRRKGRDAPAFILRVYSGVLAATLAGVVVLGWSGDGFSRAFDNPGLGRLLWIGCLYPLGLLLGQCLPLLLLSLNRHAESAAATVAIALFQGASVALAALLGGGLRTIVWVLGAASGLVVLATLAVTGAVLRGMNREPAAGATGELLRYSLPLGAHGAIGNLNQRLDRFLISFFFRPQVLAIYAVGAFAEPILAILLEPIQRVLIPRFVELDQAGRRVEVRRLWHRYILKVGTPVLILFCILFAAAPELVVLLYGPGYADAAGIFRIYLLLLPFRVTSYGAVLQALGDTRSILHGTLISLVLSVSLGIPLIRVLGWQGPAVAVVFTQIVRILFLLGRIRLRLDCSWGELWPWSGWARLLLVAGASSVAGWTAGWIAPAGWISAAVSLVGFLGTYLFLARRAGLIGPEDFALIRRWLTLDLFS